MIIRTTPDVEAPGSQNNMLMVGVTGTGVVATPV
jgi:hypothetical protein